MEFMDKMIVNSLHVLVPIAIYLFYAAYRNFHDDRENDLAIIITIFSSLYICLKYNVELIDDLPLILINIPLMIAYYKRRKVPIILASIVIIFYNFKFYEAYLLLIILEYLIYYITYLFIKNKYDIKIFILFFSIIKLIFLLIVISFESHNIIFYLKAIWLSSIFLVTSLFIIYLMQKAENILRIRLLYKEIERDKQIRTTLFKITHEIKNPIAVCKGYLDMFDINNKNHAKKYIPIMKEEINKTLILLEDFLSMNKVKLNKDILDIHLLLEEVIDSFKLYLKEKGIKIKIDIIDDEVYINGDYNRLRQVFLNIIKNSIDALKENPLIEISTKLNNNKIYIYFKDNGEGIPKDIQEKIEEPFFTTKANGTGLGIPLSIDIIKSHNGKIIYDSIYGEYTKVTIILPVTNI